MAVEQCGMTTLYWDAMDKVRAGVCSLEDVLLKVHKDEFNSRPAWILEGRPQGSAMYDIQPGMETAIPHLPHEDPAVLIG
jgi:hypothetical protein